MNRIICFFILSSVLLSGCKKFLDVVPKTQAPQDVLFNTEDGFKDALSGVYIQLKDNQIYGKNLTFGYIEHLVSSWDVTAGSVEENLNQFNYGHESVVSVFDGIYSKMYTTIASTNAILNKIDEKKDVFKNDELYKIIKGECLAIRAYLHFDILRLFGSVPNDIDPRVRLPYVVKLSTELNLNLDQQSYIERVLNDLREAASLMKDIDPILKYSIAELREPGIGKAFNPSDEFLAYRYYKMNYYAIKALLARVFLWKGNTEDAYLAAKEVIEGKDRNGAVIFRLGSVEDYNSGNFLLTSEHIFSLYDLNMYNKYTTNFTDGVLKKGSNALLINNELYGNTGVDLREINLWQVRTLQSLEQANLLKKYQVEEAPVTLSLDYKQIPLIRLSELYLIAIECAPLSEAQTYWVKYLSSRNLQPSVLEQSFEQRQNHIIREYRKELFAEGQSFYAYKRVNSPKSDVIFVPASASINYVVPLPLSEIQN